LLSCNKGLPAHKERYLAMTEVPDSRFEPKFDAHGLLTAVVIDSSTKAVLMVAFMDEEALTATRETGLAHFHSRSRGRLWKKGESSDNVLTVERVLVDCDQDAIILECRPAGPTCHTGATSCFFRELDGDALRPVAT
jgi:phosphoribosyl-AMP cyclohydrolase